MIVITTRKVQTYSNSWKPKTHYISFNTQDQKVMLYIQTETTVHILNSKRTTQQGIYL